MPAVLHPAAHDEPALYLPVFRGTYADADAICYHTMAERRLVQRVHPVADRPQIVLGLGVGESAAGGRPGAEVLGLGDRPYLVSVGRVDEHKGSAMLAAFFRHLQGAPPRPAGPGPGRPGICHDPRPPRHRASPGSSTRPTSGTSCATPPVSVSPSALESFSLVVLEAWVESVPVVVNATCDPTREHCERSGGGLWFGTYREFEAVLDRLLADARAAAPPWAPGPGLRGPALPVAGPHPPLRPLPDRSGRAGPGRRRGAVTPTAPSRARPRATPSARARRPGRPGARRAPHSRPAP